MGLVMLLLPEREARTYADLEVLEYDEVACGGSKSLASTPVVHRFIRVAVFSLNFSTLVIPLISSFRCRRWEANKRLAMVMNE